MERDAKRQKDRDRADRRRKRAVQSEEGRVAVTEKRRRRKEAQARGLQAAAPLRHTVEPSSSSTVVSSRGQRRIRALREAVEVGPDLSGSRTPRGLVNMIDFREPDRWQDNVDVERVFRSAQARSKSGRFTRRGF